VRLRYVDAVSVSGGGLKVHEIRSVEVFIVSLLDLSFALQSQKCSRKIWACSTDEDYKANKKARTFNMNNAESEKVVVQPESGDNHGKNSDLSVEELEGFLNAMKYRDMQLRCKEYGLFAAGNKEILRVRLFRYLSQQAGSIGTDVLKQTEEHKATTEVLKQTEEHKATTEDEIAIDVVKVPSVEHVETKADVDIKMEDAQPSIEKAPTAMPAKEIATSNLVEPVRVSCAGTMQPTKETTSELVVEEHVKDPSGSFSSEGAGPAIPIREIGTKSPLRVFVKDAVKQMTHSAQKARLVGHISTPGDHLSPPPSDCTASTSCSKISGTRVREIVSKLTTSQPSSTLSNKLQASKDARMARLAEVRGKVSYLRQLQMTKGVVVHRSDRSSFFIAVTIGQGGYGETRTKLERAISYVAIPEQKTGPAQQFIEFENESGGSDA